MASLVTLANYTPAAVVQSRLVHAVGLFNQGNTCFMNSVIQALLSCPAFCSWLALNGNKAAAVADFAQLYINMAMPTFGNLISPEDFAKHIINREIVRGGQQDAEACFQRIIEVLHEPTRLELTEAASLNSVFALRYNCELLCKSCGNLAVTPATTAVPQNWVEMPTAGEYGDVSGDRPITNEAEFTQYLREFRSHPKDYSCEKCGSRNRSVQTYRLARISPVCVVVFKKYTGKHVQFFPQTFAINNRSGGSMHYDVVAQIEHSGNAQGGHYWAYGRRLVPGGKTGVFNLNDGHTDPHPAGFAATENTYMVMYSRRL